MSERESEGAETVGSNRNTIEEELRHEPDLDQLDQTGVFLKEEASPEQKKKKIITYVVVAILAISVTVIYFLYEKSIMKFIHDNLSSVLKKSDIVAFLIIVGSQFIFGMVLFLPGLFYFNILIAIIMRDMYLVWALTFIGEYLASLLVFFVIRTFFAEFFQEKLKFFIPYQILKYESKKNPLRNGIVFMSLFIPANVKNYSIAISELKFWQACVAFFPGPLMICLLSAMLGSKMEHLDELINPKDFSSMTIPRKVQFFLTIGMMVFSVAFLIFTALYYRRQYNQFKQRQESGNDTKEAELKTGEHVL